MWLCRAGELIADKAAAAICNLYISAGRVRNSGREVGVLTEHSEGSQGGSERRKIYERRRGMRKEREQERRRRERERNRKEEKEEGKKGISKCSKLAFELQAIQFALHTVMVLTW